MKLAKLKKNGRGSVVLKEAMPAKIDLGCGPNKKPGFFGVDQTAFPGVDLVFNLRQPWPWSDNSVEEVHCSHCLEHFDAMERVHFINALYRVLAPGVRDAAGKPVKGFCTLIVPHWASCRAYGDPTHQWPPVSEFAFYYWKRDWRMANAPHTDALNLPGGFNCNFEVTWGYGLEAGVAMRNAEYQQMAMTYYKEACTDIIATVMKV